MKSIHCMMIPLLAAALPAQAQLLATIETTEGDVVVELQHEAAPLAVANFMTLAKGTRTRLDPLTGSLTREPLFVGEKFYRVVNDETFKIAQTGSGTGTNSGGPGFTFQDEFDDELLHDPYVVAMANSGPNSNGSQIYLTGDTAIPGLDMRHTVFGRISDPDSRAVVDAILAAGDDGSSITGVGFSREDEAAESFDEHAQGLPVLRNATGRLVVEPGLAATWQLENVLVQGDIFRVHASATLEEGSWEPLSGAVRHVGIAGPEPADEIGSVTLDEADAERRFYRIVVAEHPGAVAPADLAGRTIELELGDDLLVYEVDPSGMSGDGSYFVGDETEPELEFEIEIPSLASTAHEISFIVENIGIQPGAFLVRLGCDDVHETQIAGRHSMQSPQGEGWQNFSAGNALIRW